MIIKNEETGEEIHLKETNKLQELKSQWNLLGMNGLAYSPWANNIQDKIKEIENGK